MKLVLAICVSADIADSRGSTMKELDGESLILVE